MSQPRFLLLHGVWDRGVPRPVWPNVDNVVGRDDSSRDCWYSWRLLGTNNRELGRGAVVYDSPQACTLAVRRMRAGVESLRPTVLIGVDRQWWWRVDAAGTAFAVAARGYQRQRECRYSLAMFIQSLSVAAGLDGLSDECVDTRCAGTGGPGRRPPRNLRLPPLAGRGVA